MNFNRLVTDSKEGLKRNISSRRENISITIEEFSLNKSSFEGSANTGSANKKSGSKISFFITDTVNMI